MFKTFDRLYYRPSSDEASKLFITDFECWTPEGKKWLIQAALGDDKAANMGVAIK